MRIGTIAGAAVALVLSGCGGTPASIDDVESDLREHFSEGDAEVTWISVTQEGEDESDFVAQIDITDPEEEEGSRTARCEISATTISSSRTCQSVRPSVGDTIAGEIAESYGARGADVGPIDINRTDSGDFEGTVALRDPRTGQQITVNCTAEVDSERYEWNCGNGGA